MNRALTTTIIRLGRAAADRDAVFRARADSGLGDPDLHEIDFCNALIDSARELRAELLDRDDLGDVPVDVTDQIGPPFDPAEPCEMWCGGQPIGWHGEQARDGCKASCPDCIATTIAWSRDVLPGIAQHGYYAPPEASLDQEAAIMISQSGARDRMHRCLTDLFDSGTADRLMRRDR